MNANWTATTDGDDGHFEIMVVTEDGRPHTAAPSPAAMLALLSMARPDAVLLWDDDSGTLIAANLVGQWLPDDWSTRASPRSDSPG